MFQENNLFIGTSLAAEIPSSSSELSAFIIIGSYVPAPKEASDLSESSFQEMYLGYPRFLIEITTIQDFG
ncbi:hypothetical protein KDAU_65730 [Dictyobacter aurantiacus]|uniref:Uncharacterized protein n=2 Tax=Dictyobacter aurantiacus TaxID=1936993 RepID=A0A401ZR39_9CHLR|nr:hypothetical protein KDAU_65730 [Dictyobacter aurantiacus]